MGFNEKIKNLKVDKSYVDKFEARKFVNEKYLPKLFGVYEDVNFNVPEKCVIKMTNACKRNLFVTDGKVDKELLSRWLGIDYNRLREPQYNFKARILVEDFVDNILDYKFYCFHGEPKFIQLITGRHEKLGHCVYDLDWNKLPVTLNKHTYPVTESFKPKLLNEMIELAKELSKPFDFVRIDLYSDENKVYFGEFTFTPCAGHYRIEPESYNETWGDWI